MKTAYHTKLSTGKMFGQIKWKSPRPKKILSAFFFVFEKCFNPGIKKFERELYLRSEKKVVTETWRWQVAECVEYIVKINFSKVKTDYSTQKSCCRKKCLDKWTLQNWKLSHPKSCRGKNIFEKMFHWIPKPKSYELPAVQKKSCGLKLDSGVT